VDCAAAASCGWMADAVNRIVDMRSNVMDLFFSPVGKMLLVLGMVSVSLGVIMIVLSVMAKRRARRRRRARRP
ncbi:MAG: hypothetical protein K2L18_06685, partial [Acetatifactor sp.]|nr:hypothetical protein [Acetatifactor sp.]